MDHDLSDDQRLFVDTTTRFIQSAYPISRVRKGLADDADLAGYRRQAADLGWFSMLVPASLGGGSVSDNGLFDCALVALARGFALQPGTFVGTNVVAFALGQRGSPHLRERVLPQLLCGDGSATWATTASDAGGPEAGVIVQRQGEAFLLSGAKTLVQDAHCSDWLLVTAASDDGTTQLLVSSAADGIEVELLDSLDLTRRFCAVTFRDAQVGASSLVGEFGDGAALADRQLQIANVLTVAEAIGAMDHLFALALQYAKDRVAFGRPIGSFQAVKHLLADTSLALEMSKAMATVAARAVGTNAPDAAEVASMAKAFVGDAATDLAQACFQVFGGIGFTWEHDQHLYQRRLATDSVLYGDPVWHRERVCQLGRL